MKRYFYLLPVMLLLILIGAKEKDDTQVDPMFEVAIADFSKTKIYRKDSVFNISMHDTVFIMKPNKLPLKGGWHLYRKMSNFIVVCINANTSRVLVTKKTQIGAKATSMPSRFIEKDGKLFLWYDDNFPLTPEAFRVYKKYNLLQDDEGGLIETPTFWNDDTRKGADYYFCRNNPKRYKRVTTNIGLGYYEPPKVRCD